MMQMLTDAELDAVSAGAASASLTIASLLALGPNNATVSAENVDIYASAVGSNTAFVGGSFSATSD